MALNAFCALKFYIITSIRSTAENSYRLIKSKQDIIYHQGVSMHITMQSTKNVLAWTKKNRRKTDAEENNWKLENPIRAYQTARLLWKTLIKKQFPFKYHGWIFQAVCFWSVLFCFILERKERREMCVDGYLWKCVNVCCLHNRCRIKLDNDNPSNTEQQTCDRLSIMLYLLVNFLLITHESSV